MPSKEPLGWERLRPYQRDSARRLASGEVAGLWFAPGTGKTSTIETALWLAGADRKGPILYVTRAIGRHVWARDAEWALGTDWVPGTVWGEKPHDVSGIEPDGTYTSVNAALSRHNGVVTNYEVLGREDIARVPWGAMVLDEAHAIKGGYLPERKAPSVYTVALRLARAIQSRGGVVWEGTATPVPDRRRDLYGQLNVVLPGLFGSSWQFVHRYCDAKPGTYGGLDTSGKSNSEELRERVSRHFILLTRAAVADQLPALQRDVRVVTPKEQTLKGLGGTVERAIARAAEIKLPYGLDLAAEYLATRGKVVITTVRRELAHAIEAAVRSKEFRARLPRGVREEMYVGLATGEQDPSRRMELVNAFNEMRSPGVLAATSDSMRESINLHKITAAVVLGLPNTAGAVEQLEGRFVRLGGNPVIVHYLVAVRTIDEAIRSALLSKLTDTVTLGVDTQGGGGISSALRGRDEEVMSRLRAWIEAQE